MDVFDQMTGVMHTFPDGAAQEQIAQAMGGHRRALAEREQTMQSLSGIGKLITNAMPINYTPQHATVSTGAAMGMSPQALQATLDRQQGIIQQNQQQQFQTEQAQQDRSVRQQYMEMQQRQSIAHDLQREKDRAQQIALEDKRMRNEIKAQRIRESAQKEQERYKQQQGTLRSTPGGGTAQVTFDESGVPTVNQIISGREPVPRGGRGAAGGGQRVWHGPTQQYYTKDEGGNWVPEINLPAGAGAGANEDWSKWRLTEDHDGNKIWAHPDGSVRPLTPVEQQEVGIVEQGNSLVGKVKGRKAKGEILLQEGWAPEQANAYLDAIGATDDNSLWPFYAGEQWRAQGSNAPQGQPQVAAPVVGSQKMINGRAHVFTGDGWEPL